MERVGSFGNGGSASAGELSLSFRLKWGGELGMKDVGFDEPSHRLASYPPCRVHTWHLRLEKERVDI